MPLFSVIIPTYNRPQLLAEAIESVLAQSVQDFEIVVVDDCSSDKSLETSRSYNLRVYSLTQHMGKGCALRVGFSKAKGNLIATIDSDGSHHPEEMPLLLKPILRDQADFVIGSRFLNKKPVSGKKLNAVGVRLFNALIKAFTKTSVTDSQSGYRVMKAEIVKAYRLVSGGYEIESEMLVKTARCGFRVKEVPISFEQRTYGRSRLDPILDGLRILLSIVAAYIKR